MGCVCVRVRVCVCVCNACVCVCSACVFCRNRSRVDRQVSKLCNMSAKARENARNTYKFTRLVFSALEYHGLVPVVSQRVVASLALNISTAIDLVCVMNPHRHAKNAKCDNANDDHNDDEDASAAKPRLCLVELKCGFLGDRSASVRKFKLGIDAADSCYNRHFAQLACTRELFLKESALLKTLRSPEDFGMHNNVLGFLLYVNDTDTELLPLPLWWQTRGTELLAKIR
jgi:hypothetical protein